MSSADDVMMRRTAKGKRGPSTSTTRHTTITRYSAGPSGPAIPVGAVRVSNVRSSLSSAPMYVGGTAEAKGEEVGRTLQNRQREKSDIQELNKRLAGYIDNCRILEAQNKALSVQLENERKKKLFDPEELKELYAQEMDAKNKLIDELSEEKAEFAPKISKLQEQLEFSQSECDNLEDDKRDYVKKLEMANNQVGSLTGEVNTLRNQLALKDDQISKLQDKIKRLEAELNDQRASLEEETRQRIAAEMAQMSAMEAFEFQRNIYEAEIEEYKKMLSSDKDEIDIRNMLQSHMTDTIRELQEDSDRKIDQIRMDLQAKFDAQVAHLQTGLNRDQLDRSKYEAEIQRLKNKLADANPKLADLESQLDALRRRNANLEIELKEEKEDHERDNAELRAKIEELMRKLEDMSEQFQVLLDDKCNLEMEIATYRKMMDVEDNHMRELFDSSIGARSKGANMLNDLVQSSSSMTSSSGGGFGGGYRSETVSSSSMMSSSYTGVKVTKTSESKSSASSLSYEKSSSTKTVEREPSPPPEQQKVEKLINDYESKSSKTEKMEEQKEEPKSDKESDTGVETKETKVASPLKEDEPVPEKTNHVIDEKLDEPKDAKSDEVSKDKNLSNDDAKECENGKPEVDHEDSHVTDSDVKMDASMSMSMYEEKEDSPVTSPVKPEHGGEATGQETTLTNGVEDDTDSTTKPPGMDSMSVTDTKFIVKRSFKGKVQFENIELDGSHISLYNNDAVGDVNLNGYKVARIINNKEVASYVFGDFVLEPKKSVKVFGSEFEHKMQAARSRGNTTCFMMNNFRNWKKDMSGSYVLTDPKGNEKASMRLESQE